MADLHAAQHFLATHARLLERRRFDQLTGAGSPDQVLAALLAYRNADGGFGSGLEPDLRSSSSQPVGVLTAFEVLEEVRGPVGPLAGETLDWLEPITAPDGGVPFVLPNAGDAPHAAPWTPLSDPPSSLHMTAAIAAAGHRLARSEQGLAGHPWLRRATDYCWARLDEDYVPPHAIELRYVVEFLDAVPEEERAVATLEALRRHLPATGRLAVAGGAEGETQTTTDFSPDRAARSRRFFDPGVIARDLDRLDAGQRPDGGWEVDWAAFSPMSDLEWRGIATVRAVRILAANDRLPGPNTR